MLCLGRDVDHAVVCRGDGADAAADIPEQILAEYHFRRIARIDSEAQQYCPSPAATNTLPLNAGTSAAVERQAEAPIPAGSGMRAFRCRGNRG